MKQEQLVSGETRNKLANGRISRAFTAHPASVDESYSEHARFALGFAVRLFGASCAALIHAVFPFLFEKTAGRMTLQLAEHLKSRS